MRRNGNVPLSEAKKAAMRKYYKKYYKINRAKEIARVGRYKRRIKNAAEDVRGE